MNPFLVALILVALVSAAGFAGAGSIRKAREESRISALKLGSMGRDEVLRMLATVEPVRGTRTHHGRDVLRTRMHAVGPRVRLSGLRREDCLRL